MQCGGGCDAFAAASDDDAGSVSEDEAPVHRMDLEKLRSLEKKHLSHASCAAERCIETFAIGAPRDLGRLEAAIRGVLKCDFGACAALEASAYVSVRIKFLRQLRLRRNAGHMGRVSAPGTDRDETVHLTDTMLLVVHWGEMTVSLVERTGAIGVRAR